MKGDLHCLMAPASWHNMHMKHFFQSECYFFFTEHVSRLPEGPGKALCVLLFWKERSFFCTCKDKTCDRRCCLIIAGRRHFAKTPFREEVFNFSWNVINFNHKENLYWFLGIPLFGQKKGWFFFMEDRIYSGKMFIKKFSFLPKTSSARKYFQSVGWGYVWWVPRT